LSKYEKTRPLAKVFEAASGKLREQRQVRLVDGRSPAEVVELLEKRMQAQKYEIQRDPGSFSPPRTQ